VRGIAPHRRWQVSPQQVFDRRRQARVGSAKASVPAAADFVPIVPERSVATPEPAACTAAALPTPSIQVRMAGAVLRMAPSTDMDLLTAALRAIRASAA
jgi:transposase